MIVISDTSIITNLAAIQHLQLLPQLYNQVIIPEAVYRELTDIDPPVPGSVESVVLYNRKSQVPNKVFIDTSG